MRETNAPDSLRHHADRIRVGTDPDSYRTPTNARRGGSAWNVDLVEACILIRIYCAGTIHSHSYKRMRRKACANSRMALSRRWLLL